MSQKRKKTPKQIAALVCVILLLSLYIFTFIVALLDFPDSDRLFAACLTATIGLPILLWIYLELYKKVKKDSSEVEAFESDDSSK